MTAFHKVKHRIKRFVVPVLFYGGYYSWLLRKADRSSGRGNNRRCLILMYHRITAHSGGSGAQARGSRDSQCGISRQNFEGQMQFLMEHMNPISLSFLVKSLQNRSPIPPRSVVVTFDDGYADNYFNAYPVLRKYRIPATIFLVTSYISTGKRFWWDQLRAMVQRNPNLPMILEKHCPLPPHVLSKWLWKSSRSCGPQSYNELAESLITHIWRNQDMSPDQLIDLLGGVTCGAGRPDVDLSQGRVNDACHRSTDDYGDRFEMRDARWHSFFARSFLHPHSADTSLIGTDEAVPSLTGADEAALSLTWEQIQEMSRHGLEFGSHTVSHPNMVHLSSSKVEEELRISKKAIEKHLGCPVEGFAYPIGQGEHYNTRIKALVQKAGFAYACTAQPGCIYPESWDILSLNRIPPPNSLPCFVRDLSHYLTIPYHGTGNCPDRPGSSAAPSTTGPALTDQAVQRPTLPDHKTGPF